MNSKRLEEYNSDEWKRRREEILLRDKYLCTDCQSPNNLQVHHKKYYGKLKAWEYPDKYLITLCRTCHEKVHLNNPISSFYSDKQIAKYSFIEEKIKTLAQFKQDIKYYYETPIVLKYSVPRCNSNILEFKNKAIFAIGQTMLLYPLFKPKEFIDKITESLTKKGYSILKEYRLY